MKVQKTIGKKVALSTCGINQYETFCNTADTEVRKHEVGVEGLEPSITVPKTAALPLGYTPKIPNLRYFIKTLFNNCSKATPNIATSANT